MSQFIEVYNETIDATTRVPVGALDHYRDKGWVPVEDAEGEDVVEDEVEDLESSDEEEEAFEPQEDE
jgi:Ran GTPase-activating protein (RanGAP) involved in mRNA processing and transport